MKIITQTKRIIISPKMVFVEYNIQSDPLFVDTFRTFFIGELKRNNCTSKTIMKL